LHVSPRARAELSKVAFTLKKVAFILSFDGQQKYASRVVHNIKARAKFDVSNTVIIGYGAWTIAIANR
jgi:hypothetical protein